MANKYLVGSGAFTSTSIWSTTYGGSSGASVPVSGDIIYVDNNYNITSALPSSSSFDFIVRLGANTASGVTLGLSGSPTFRSLDIRSANSAAHTVKFDISADITVEKFVAIGSDSSGKLGFSGDGATVHFVSGGSSYGQYVDMGDVPMGSGVISSGSGVPKYIGSNSTQSGANNWLLQDPPKISTLVDPLTTAPGSNTNWTVSGTVTAVTSGHDGGGYQLASGAEITSTDTYDLTDSEIIIERPAESSAIGNFGVDGLGGLNNNPGSNSVWSSIFDFGGTKTDVGYKTKYSQSGGGSLSYEYPISTSKFWKFGISGNTLSLRLSDNGTSWSAADTLTLSDLEVSLFKSARIRGDNGLQAIGSINPSLSTEVTKTQLGTARVAKAIARAQQSSGRVSKAVNSLQTAISHIVIAVARNQNSVSRIQNTVASTQDSISNIRASFVFSRGSYESLPVDDSDLAIPYNSTEVSNVSAEDDVYTNQGGSGFLLHEYKMYHNFSTATITVKWVGKSTVPCNEEPVYLQIYNYNAGVWVTLDSDSTSSAGANFELIGTPSGNNGDYYDPDGFIAVRVYQ